MNCLCRRLLLASNKMLLYDTCYTRDHHQTQATPAFTPSHTGMARLSWQCYAVKQEQRIDKWVLTCTIRCPDVSNLLISSCTQNLNNCLFIRTGALHHDNMDFILSIKYLLKILNRWTYNRDTTSVNSSWTKTKETSTSCLDEKVRVPLYFRL